MRSNRPALNFLAAVAAVLCVAAWPTDVVGAGAPGGTGSPVKPVDIGAYVVRIYQRILSLGTSIVEFEERLVYRLEQKRPVDFPRAVARYRSAKHQILALRHTGLALESKIPPGDPKQATIETLKKKIPLIREAHRKAFIRLKALAGAELAAANQMVEDACVDVPTPPPASFPVQSVDAQF